MHTGYELIKAKGERIREVLLSLPPDFENKNELLRDFAFIKMLAEIQARQYEKSLERELDL